MDFLKSQGIELLKAHHDHHNDTTGDTPLPEIPHHRGLMEITSAGERTLWIVFAIMTISTVVFAGWSLRQPRKLRLFPAQITMFITTAAAISYFAMATHNGRAIIRAPGHNAYREVFWARYADWLVTTPLLLLDLTLFSGLPLADTLLLMVADIGMILTGLFGALDNGYQTRFAFYGFSCAFFIYILYTLLYSASKTGYARSDKIGKAYTGIAVYTAILWIGYPIIWSLAEGTNYITADMEVLLYGILDVAAKPGFGFFLLALHASLPESHVALSSTWTEPRGGSNSGYGAIPSSD